jgi:hypothetical protein
MAESVDARDSKSRAARRPSSSLGRGTTQQQKNNTSDSTTPPNLPKQPRWVSAAVLHLLAATQSTKKIELAVKIIDRQSIRRGGGSS